MSAVITKMSLWHQVLYLLLLLINRPCISNSQTTTNTPVTCNLTIEESTSTARRCGIDWSDANSKCGQLCPCSLNAECSLNAGETCFSLLSDIPCFLENTNTTYPPLSNFTIPTIGSCGTQSLFPLAFDDGPWTTHNASLKIAEKLYLRNISGTFFVSPAGVNGNNTIELNRKCTLIGKMLDYGHYVESHSWTHPDFSTITNEQIITEIRKTRNFIVNCAKQAGYNDYVPTLFRPPFSRLNITQAVLINQLGYNISVWNFDSLDYSNFNNLTIILDNFRSNTTHWTNNGSSISALFHDFAIYDIIDDIIDYVIDELGYKPINSKECFELCDTYDIYGICRDPTGNDWSTIYKWYEEITYLQYLVYELNATDSIWDYFTFDIPPTTTSLHTTVFDDNDNDDENVDFFDSPVDWVKQNIMLSLIIGISIFTCFLCCIIRRICEKNKLCVVDDGFDEYFKSRHGHMVSQQDVSIHSQTA